MVNVDNGLVGRSRSGGVRRVEQPRDVRSAGGWGVLMLSEHSVSEGSGQEHDQGRRRGKGRRMVDGGKGRDETEGRRTHLYTGEWHRTRCIGQNAVSFIFHKRSYTISRLGFSTYDIYYHYFVLFIIFVISNFVISNILFIEFRCRTPTRATRLPATCTVSTWRYDALGFPFKLPTYKSILAFLVSWFPTDQLVIVHPCPPLYPGITSLSHLGSLRTIQSACGYICTYPASMISLYYRTSWPTAGQRIYRNMSVSSAHPMGTDLY